MSKQLSVNQHWAIHHFIIYWCSHCFSKQSSTVAQPEVFHMHYNECKPELNTIPTNSNKKQWFAILSFCLVQYSEPDGTLELIHWELTLSQLCWVRPCERYSITHYVPRSVFLLFAKHNPTATSYEKRSSWIISGNLWFPEHPRMRRIRFCDGIKRPDLRS